MARHPQTASEVTEASCRIGFDRPSDESLCVRFSGSWTLESRLPPAASVFDRFDSEDQVRRIEFNTEELAGWDSGLLTFLIKIIDECNRRQIGADRAGLPEGVRRLVEMDRRMQVDATYTIFSMICIELWCRMFIDRPTPTVC